MLLGIFVGLLLGVGGFALFQDLYEEKKNDLKADVKNFIEEELAATETQKEEKKENQEAPQKLGILYGEVEQKNGKDFFQKIFLENGGKEAKKIVLSKNAYRFEIPTLSHNEIFFYTAEKNQENAFNNELSLFRTDLEGENEKEVLLYTPGVFPNGFVPSPDRKKIAYFLDSRVDKGSEIWVYDAEKGINFVAIELFDKQINKNIVSWDAGSRRLYFLKKMSPYLYILHYIDADSGPKVQTQEFQKIYWEGVPWKNLLSSEIILFNLSPDKKYIAFLSPLKNEIRLINTESGVFKTLKPNGVIKEILWQPDSRSLIYTKNDISGIFQIDLSLGREEEFVDTEESSVKNIQITPDGRFLGFTEEKEDVSQVVLIDLKSAKKRVIAHEDGNSMNLRLFSLSYLSEERPFQEEISSEFQTKRVQEESSEDTERAIKYITGNINAIVLERKKEGWEVKRFWFVDKRNVYVDIQSNDELQRILISFDVLTDNEAGYRIKAYFEAEGDKWVLKKGEAPEGNPSLVLYVFNKYKNKWEKNE